MRNLAAASLIFALAAPAVLAQEAPPVAVDKASYHVPAFRNELVAVTNVYIPPGRQAGYHIHSLDQLSVVVEDADQAGQELGGQPYPPRRTPRGNVGYTAFHEDTSGAQPGFDAVPQRRHLDPLSHARALHRGLP
jgi:hypothetical protein